MRVKAIVSCLALAGTLGMGYMTPGLADEVYYKATSYGVAPASETFVLPSSSSYVMVDPLTGVVKGNYTTGISNSSIGPGWVVMDSSTNKIMAGFDSSGRLRAITDVPVYDAYLSNLDVRRAAIETAIADAVAKGKISLSAGEDMKAELMSAHAQLEAYRSSRNWITYDEALSVASRFNRLSDRLGLIAPGYGLTALVGNVYTPVVSAGGTTVVTRTVAQPAVVTTPSLVSVPSVVAAPQSVVVSPSALRDNLSLRNEVMAKKADAEFNAGRLTNRNVVRIKEKLNDVSIKQAKYTKGGNLSLKRQGELNAKLDEVQTYMDQCIADTNDKRQHIGLKVN